MKCYIEINKALSNLNDYALVESPSDNESVEERRISNLAYNVIQNCIEAVEEVPVVTEAEIKLKAIEEFVDIAKEICATCGLGTDREKYIPVYIHKDGTWHDLLNDVAEQMKANLKQENTINYEEIER